MTSTCGPVLLVGCGKMGGAMLGGWLASGVAADQIKAVEPVAELAAAARAAHGIEAVPDLAALDPAFAPRVVVFAVKPQVMDRVIPPYGRFRGPDTVFLSIAAGKSIAAIAGRLGEPAAIVRAMPNTPASIGRGISVMCANDAVTVSQRDACRALLAAVGAVEVIGDEALLDAVTAVSGSGPAYVFSVDRMPGRRRRRGRAARRSRESARPGHGCRLGGARRPVAGVARDPAPQRHQPPRHHPGGARCADGR